ncbi:MAG TPA: hypothetical protein VFS43_13225 [Polyangiaceae bacterium]|nr:hypothetical protein [Polyangiaceae bacterium]
MRRRGAGPGGAVGAAAGSSLRALALGAWAALALAACGAHVRPRVLDEAGALGTSAQGREARELAPMTFAEAERFRLDGERAAKDGNEARAQLLGERALAAYARATIQARALRAKVALERANADLAVPQGELASLQAEQGRADAEVRDLETRSRLAREALPAGAPGALDPGREAARLEASRSLATEARLLCLSAKLLGGAAGALGPAEAQVAELGKALDAKPRQAPVELALRTRASCLSALVQSRREARAKRPAEDADVLLTALSREGSFTTSRDDRGVVVTLHDAFAGGALSAGGRERLASLAKVAAAHPTLPLVAVVHEGEEPRGAALERSRQRAGAVKGALGERAEVVLAGASRPVVAATGRAERGRNERLEVVFVDAGS